MMTGLCIVLGIVLSIAYIGMTTIMVMLERDKPKNIIIWSIVFLVSQVVGYVVYLVLRHVFYKKRNSFITKLKEDEIYNNLTSNKLLAKGIQPQEEVFIFNNMAFETQLTANNDIDLINDYDNFKNKLISDISKAKKYIIFEITKIHRLDLIDIEPHLIKKANDGVLIKIVHDRKINSSIVKRLREAGIKVYRFSKHNTVGYVYSNLRNIISIDGETAYLARFYNKRKMKSSIDVAQMAIRIRGDVVQDINMQVHKDTIFASGKYIQYSKLEPTNIKNDTLVQFVSNNFNSDMELAIVKAICMAKKSIQLQLTAFIPTESIKSLLKFAINSNIQVKLMVPLKNDKHGKYFASRAYAKELALMGANVYLFDGYINFNAITVDDEYVIYGSFILDREHLNTSPQNILFIKDAKIVKNFNKAFEKGIENSYRISNAKFMLLREKFFKNFV